VDIIGATTSVFYWAAWETSFPISTACVCIRAWCTSTTIDVRSKGRWNCCQC